MIYNYQDNIHFIVPGVIKRKILKELSSLNKIYNIHFDTLESFKEKYYYKIKKEATLYLLEKKESLDSIKTYLPYLYNIDITKSYKHSKLEKLKNIKKELLANNYLEENIPFREYIKTKKIVVMGYPYLNKYEKKLFEELGAVISLKDYPFNISKVYKFTNVSDEIAFVASKIRELNSKGISYKHIFISGITNNYKYLLQEIFKDFDIPVDLVNESSFTSCLVAKEYLKKKDYNLIKDEELKEAVIKKEEELSYALNSSYYQLLLEDGLKKIKLGKKELADRVRVLDEALEHALLVGDDDYMFTLGFNQNYLPKIYKDEEYLPDISKEELEVLTSSEKNKIAKEILINSLSSIKNLTISYSTSANQEELMKSSLIDEFKIEEEESSYYNLSYSNSYNLKKWGESLDLYYTYKEKTKDLESLSKYYQSSLYNSYDNTYKPFKIKKEALTLSYSKIDDYTLCPFRYFAKNILKLEEFEVNFSQKLGTIYHYVLSKIYEEDFSFDKSFSEALCEVELNVKEKFLLKKLKKELEFIISDLKEKEQSTMLNTPYLEEKIEIALESDVTLKGFIDKILTLNKNDKTYYAIYDYKTGNNKINLDYINEGLFLQLPIYMYLVEKSKKFNNPIFLGLFYQVLLSNTKDLDKRRKELMMSGVVTSNKSILPLLDEAYEDSSYIKGLKTNKSGELNSRLKVLSEDEKDELLIKLEEKLKEIVKNIRESSFEIAPKILNNQNISCTYCPFKAICYHQEKDNYYIKRKEEEDA